MLQRFFNGLGGSSAGDGNYSIRAVAEILPAVAWSSPMVSSDWPAIHADAEPIVLRGGNPIATTPGAPSNQQSDPRPPRGPHSNSSRHLTARRYARIGHGRVESIGSDPEDFGTHSLRRTEVAQIHRRPGNRSAGYGWSAPRGGHLRASTRSRNAAEDCRRLG